VEDVAGSVQGSKLKAEGPLLITHWGMSGPAILKTSAFGARLLHERDYRFHLQVNWVKERSEEKVLEHLRSIAKEHPKKQLKNIPAYGLPERLWGHLLDRGQLSGEKAWQDLGKKGMNRLVDRLTRDVYSVEGRSTFKEEFVTCGGVSWESVDPESMQSRVVPGLYFAGEILDVDAITGGYNFQAAWTTGYVAGLLRG
jgi:predicted Rossmann fold flavoprotein